MDSQSPTSQLVALINRRLTERAEPLRVALQDALAKLAAAPLLRAEEIEAQLPPPPPPAAPAGADLNELRRWVAAIDDDRSQVNILKSLIQGAREYAARVALFVIRGDSMAGWAAAGFTGTGTASDDKVKGVNMPLTTDTVVARVASSATPFTGPANQQRQNDVLFDALGGIEPHEIAAFPISNKGRVAAVLYADCGSAPAIASLDALEILARAAAMSIELIPVRPKAAAPAAQPAAASAAPAAAPARPSPVAAPAAAPAAPAHPAPTHAAPAHAAPAAAPSAAAPAAARPAAVDLSRLPPEEQKLHEAAKRFARLLVSEIKLYNEAKVIEGRKSRDLYTRLREDIDRSRQMYNQRVNPKIAQSTNYFYDELVHALAEGDAALLAGYPPS